MVLKWCARLHCQVWQGDTMNIKMLELLPMTEYNFLCERESGNPSDTYAGYSSDSTESKWPSELTRVDPWPYMFPD